MQGLLSEPLSLDGEAASPESRAGCGARKPAMEMIDPELQMGMDRTKIALAASDQGAPALSDASSDLIVLIGGLPISALMRQAEPDGGLSRKASGGQKKHALNRARRSQRANLANGQAAQGPFKDEARVSDAPKRGALIADLGAESLAGQARELAVNGGSGKGARRRRKALQAPMIAKAPPKREGIRQRAKTRMKVFNVIIVEENFHKGAPIEIDLARAKAASLKAARIKLGATLPERSAERLLSRPVGGCRQQRLGGEKKLIAKESVVREIVDDGGAINRKHEGIVPEKEARVMIRVDEIHGDEVKSGFSRGILMGMAAKASRSERALGKRFTPSDEIQPLGLRIRGGDAKPPEAGASELEWMVWGVSGSALAEAFWSACLAAPDPVWSRMTEAMRARSEELVESDGSMAFDKFAKRAAEEALNGKMEALNRFASLCERPEWRARLLVTNRTSALGWAPALKAMCRWSACGWQEHPRLQAIAQERLQLEMDQEIRSKGVGGGNAKNSIHAQELARGLALKTPRDAADEELLRKLGEYLGESGKAKARAEALRESQPLAGELERVWGAPNEAEREELIKELCHDKAWGEKSLSESLQIEDAQAIDRAWRLEWMSKEQLSQAMEKARQSGFEAMGASLEALLLEADSPQGKAPASASSRL